MPPVRPMLAKATQDLPDTEGLLFEPKWDGYRCIVFRDGDEVELGSRNDKPLTRYFPELLRPILTQLPERCVLDGELVVVTTVDRPTPGGPQGDGAGNARLDFDLLSQRIHPAQSRVIKLAMEIPASFVAFDLLALGDRSLVGEPFAERRRLLEELMASTEPPLHITPATTDRSVAQEWFEHFEGAGLDGVMAKPLAGTYQPAKRVQWKVKHKRTADCVVAGFRQHKDGEGVGSLLLGLYDDEGALHHVGVAASFTATRRRELVDELAPYRMSSFEGHPWAGWGEAVEHDGSAVSEARATGDAAPAQRRPGAPSRWNSQKDLSWTPLRPDLVCEVTYEHLQSGRFRHMAHFQRWRADKDPSECTYAQLEQVVPYELTEIFSSAV